MPLSTRFRFRSAGPLRPGPTRWTQYHKLGCHNPQPAAADPCTCRCDRQTRASLVAAATSCTPATSPAEFTARAMVTRAGSGIGDGRDAVVLIDQPLRFAFHDDMAGVADAPAKGCMVGARSCLNPGRRRCCTGTRAIRR